MPGKIVEVRKRLAGVWRAPGGSRDVLLLDIALDNYFRCEGVLCTASYVVPIVMSKCAALWDLPRVWLLQLSACRALVECMDHSTLGTFCAALW